MLTLNSTEKQPLLATMMVAFLLSLETFRLRLSVT